MLSNITILKTSQIEEACYGGLFVEKDLFWRQICRINNKAQLLRYYTNSKSKIYTQRVPGCRGYPYGAQVRKPERNFRRDLDGKLYCMHDRLNK